jgi:hypothetical protein
MSIDAVSDHSQKLEKFDWLTRPVDWALYICLQAFGGLLMVLWLGRLDLEAMLAIAIAALGVTAGLLIWASMRMGRAFSGRR